jgi:hypothetical protein
LDPSRAPTSRDAYVRFSRLRTRRPLRTGDRRTRTQAAMSSSAPASWRLRRREGRGNATRIRLYFVGYVTEYAGSNLLARVLRLSTLTHNMLDPCPPWKTPSGSILAPPRGRLRKILHPNFREKPSTHSGEHGVVGLLARPDWMPRRAATQGSVCRTHRPVHQLYSRFATLPLLGGPSQTPWCR